MKPLMTCQWVLSLVFLNTFEKPLNKLEKRLYIAANAVGVLCLIAYFVSSVITFVNLISTDLATAFYPMAQILGSGVCLNIMVVAFFCRQKVNEVFERLSEIYRTCKCK